MLTLPRNATRPTGPVPADDIHEFLSDWLPRDDPALTAWIKWFRLSRVRHIVRFQAMTNRNGETGIFAMIYTHRVVLPRQGIRDRSARWCCDE